MRMVSAVIGSNFGDSRHTGVNMPHGVWGGSGTDGRRRPKPDLAERNTTHGLAHHRFYPIWRDMMNRCYSEKNKYYKDYGGRGITVCEEWQRPAAFIRWCETQRPPWGYTIDRYPNYNGPYSPSNCRFASPSQQNRNMRSNVWVETAGERLIFKDFVEKYGSVSYDTAKTRLRRGWDPISAAVSPLRGRG